MVEENNTTTAPEELAQAVLSLYSRALAYSVNHVDEHIRRLEPSTPRQELVERLIRTRERLVERQDRLSNVALTFAQGMSLEEEHVHYARVNDFAFSETLSSRFRHVPPEAFMNAEYAGDLNGALSGIEIALNRLLPQKHDEAYKRLEWRMRAVRQLAKFLVASIEHTVEGDHGRQAIVDLDVVERIDGFTKRDEEDLDSDTI